MTDIAKLEIRIDSKDSKKAVKSLDDLAKKGGKAEKSLDKMGKETKQAARATDKLATSSKKAAMATDGLGKSAKGAIGGLKGMLTAGLAIGAIAGVFKKVISSTIAQEQAIAQLEARIISSGGAAELSVTQMTDFAASLQKVTTFGDEAIIAMQGVLLTFNNVKGEQFNHATEAILDMSVALSMDLASAAKMVGKALNDPAVGLSRLSLAGVTFTQQQKDLVKSLTDTGQAAKAQEVILAELDKQMGGSAAAARDTLGGALTGLANVFGDLFEGDSSSTGEAIIALNNLEDAIGGEGMQSAFGSMTSWVIAMSSTLAGLVTDVANAINWFGELQQAANDFAGNPMSGMAFIDQALGVTAVRDAAAAKDFSTIDREDIEMQREMNAEAQSGQLKAEESAKAVTAEKEKQLKATQSLFASQDKYYAADLAYTKKIAEINALKGSLTDEQYQKALGHERELLDATKKRLDEAGKPVATAGGGSASTSGGGGNAKVSAAEREAEQLAEMRQREFEALVDSLRSEEEVINDSYNRRVQIVMENTERGSALQIEMLDKLKDEYATAMSEMSEWSGLATDLMQDFVSGFADSFVDSLLEGEDAFRAFAYSFFRHMAKMIAQQILFNALSGFAGSSNPVLAVVGRAFSGAHDAGGTIPAGQFGIVGERGAEFVSGPAKVTGREDTAKMFQQLTDAVNSLQQPSQNVRVINVQEENAEDYLGSDPGERKVMNILRRNRSAVQGLVA